MIFSADEEFIAGDLGDSGIKEYLQELVFSKESTGINYEISSLTLENKTVNKLTEYMLEYGNEYDLEKVAKLPDEPIVQGDIKLKNLDSGETEDYMFICDKFNVSLNYIELDKNPDAVNAMGEYADTREVVVKDYTFMLILPKFVINNKIEAVNNEVQS